LTFAHVSISNDVKNKSGQLKNTRLRAITQPKIIRIGISLGKSTNVNITKVHNFDVIEEIWQLIMKKE
jgi:hypothetical protein